MRQFSFGNMWRHMTETNAAHMGGNQEEAEINATQIVKRIFVRLGCANPVTQC